VNIGLFVSSDTTVDGQDAAATAPVTKQLRLKPGRTKKFRVRVRSLPAVPDGTYHVLAQVQPTDVTGTTVAVSTQTVVIAAPFVDLRATITPPTRPTLSPGGRGVTRMLVGNLGNVPARGTATVTLAVSGDATAGSDRPLITLPAGVRINPGRSKTYRLRFTVPLDLAPGSYHLVATLNPTTDPAEQVAENNTSVSAGPFTVA
jgi:uncharacterized membrane protein